MVLNQWLTQSDRGARCRAHARLFHEPWPVTQMEHLSSPEASRWNSSDSFGVTHCWMSLLLVKLLSLCVSVRPVEESSLPTKGGTWNQIFVRRPSLSKGLGDLTPPDRVSGYYTISPKHFVPPPLTQKDQVTLRPQTQTIDAASTQQSCTEGNTNAKCRTL